MKWRVLALVPLIALTVFTTAKAFALLSDSHSASGTITATSASADLYICEPGFPAIDGPSCGADDSGADEIVFESLENIHPGGEAQWPLRLQNMGPATLTLLRAQLTVTEVSDPTDQCNGLPLVGLLHLSSFPGYIGENGDGVFVTADPNGDDQAAGEGLPYFYNTQLFPTGGSNPPRLIRIPPGGSEDVMLRVYLEPISGENCEGTQWNVQWTLKAG